MRREAKFGKKVIDYSEKAEYLASHTWKKKRTKYFEKYKKECVLCGERDCFSIALHHVTYERLGMEDIDTDLVCLCHLCHKTEHIKIEWDNSRVTETSYLLDKRITYADYWEAKRVEEELARSKKKKGSKKQRGGE